MNAAAGAVPPQFAAAGKNQPSKQREQQEDMGDYRPIYTNSYQNPYETYPQPAFHKPDSNSNGSNRSRHSQRHSVHGTTKGRLDDDRLAAPEYMHSERRRSTRERRGRSSRASHDSDDSYHDRKRRDHRSRSRRREKDKESNNDGQKQQDHHQQQGQEQEEEKKTGLAKFEQYITPFNVGILLGCFDLIGGGLSLYMTNKRFGKKAQAAQAAQNGGGGQKQGGANGGGGGGSQKQQDSKDGGSNGSSRSSGRSRGRSRRDDRSSRKGSRSSSEESYDSRDYRDYKDRDRRKEPHRLEYDRASGRSLPRSGRWAYHPAGRHH